MLLNKYTNWKKIGLLAIDALLIFNMVFSTCNLAQAYDSKSFGVEGGSFSIPEPISVIDDVLKKLNVDPGSIANMSQQLNVSEQKIPFPEVSIFFNPSDPKSGQKITAEASPMYFSTPEEKLYFTWYIKHADGSSDDVNDWKIEAMKIIGQNGYDKNDDPKPDYNNDNDSDGYFAPLVV